MSMKPIRITEQVTVYKITLQPGEVQTCPLQLSSLFAQGETITSAQSDDTSVVALGDRAGFDQFVKITGPANGEQSAVRLTVNGSLGSHRRIALVIIGSDPLMQVVPGTPHIYLRWRGGYQADEIYAPSDLVLFGGLIYLALSGSADAAPDITPASWLPWAGTGGNGGGGGNIYPDAGGSGRYGAFKTTWIGPGTDDWKIEFVGVEQ